MHETQRGLTLLELMTALAVLAVLAAIGAPTFREFTRNSAAAATQNALVTALNVARSEAVKRGRPVSVCASTDGNDCSSDPADWQRGWLAFVDNAIPGSIDAADEGIQFWRGPTGDVRVATGPDSFVQYLPDGLTSAASPLVVDIDWPGCTGERSRRIVVGVSGTITSMRLNCS